MSSTRERSRSSVRRPSGHGDGVVAPKGPRTLRRSLAWVGVPTTLATLGAGIAVSTVAPRYTGEATVIVENAGPNANRTAAAKVQGKIGRDLAREAAQRLKLVDNPEFDASLAGIGPFRQVLMLLGIGQNPLDRPAEDRVTEAYLDHLQVVASGNPRVATVAFESEDPQLAADGANAAAQLAVAALEGSAEVTRAASGPPASALASLRRRVADADAKVEAYRARKGLAGSALTAGQPLTMAQLADVSAQLSQARLQRADLAGRIAGIRDMLKDGRSLELNDLAGTDSLRRLIDNRIATRAQLALESRTLLPAHPRIKAIKAQLEDLDTQIKTSAEHAARTLENDAKAADARVASLQAALDGQRSVGGADRSDDAELAALEREAKAQRDQLAAALGRSVDTTAGAIEAAAPVARVAAPALRPTEASSPQRLPIVGGTALAAFLLSLGGLMARTLRIARRRPETPTVRREPAEEPRAPTPWPEVNPFALPEAVPPGRWLEAGASASPEARHDEPALVLAERSPAAFELEPLIHRLSWHSALPAGPVGRKIVVVDGGMSASGELHAALAKALLRSGSVIAVDLGITPAEAGNPGFTDIIAGHADFADVIQADGPGGAHHVAAGAADTETLFEEPRALAFTLEAMAEAYAWVVCRLPQGPDVTDLLALVATASDSVVIASDADPADPRLAELYAIASEAGAGQVLIAQDRPAEPAAVEFLEFRAAA